jgi:SNF2 family DNA or RNA helicase
MIRGDVKTELRGGLVEQFQKDPTCRVFVGQIDSCAEGIDLFAAHMTVYFSVNWNLAKYQQSVSRVHRIGQTHNCTYLHLVVPGTIDMKIMAALKAKEDLAHRVVDQWQTYFDD